MLKAELLALRDTLGTTMSAGALEALGAAPSGAPAGAKPKAPAMPDALKKGLGKLGEKWGKK